MKLGALSNTTFVQAQSNMSMDQPASPCLSKMLRFGVNRSFTQRMRDNKDQLIHWECFSFFSTLFHARKI